MAVGHVVAVGQGLPVEAEQIAFVVGHEVLGASFAAYGSDDCK